jgi:BirA family biotin operon repressor/biotin-[acetyl-CoA-carboxylase] ligase
VATVTARVDGDGPAESVPPWTVPASWDLQRCRPAAAGRWAVHWVETTTSTNDELVRQAEGRADRSVLVADLQTAGRGRLGRTWQAPRGTALTFSVLLRPDPVPPSRRGWVGALLGLAVTSAIARRTGLSADLKWPNDVLIDGHKAAGILAEMTPTALVVGAGVNVSIGAADLPRADATSLLLAGADPDVCGREELLAATLDELAPLLDRWVAGGGDADRSGIRADYRVRCSTLGRRVRLELPSADPVTGTAVDVDADGSIVIDDGIAVRRFAAGDVQHLRDA